MRVIFFILLSLVLGDLRAMSVQDYKDNPSQMMEKELSCGDSHGSLFNLLHAKEAKRSKEPECLLVHNAYLQLLEEGRSYYKLHSKKAEEKALACEAFMFGLETLLSKDEKAGKEMMIERASELYDCNIVQIVLKELKENPEPKKAYFD